MSIVLVERGETVETPEGLSWLYSECESQFVSFYCASCKSALPHRDALSKHCKADGEHRIVRHCIKHGYEAIQPKEAKGDTTT